jgi:O-antigen/teichoic acid export membrane protein
VTVLTRGGRSAAGLLRGPSLARVMALAMTFAFSLVVARALGPHEAGIVYAAVVGASALGMLARFGTEYAVLRHGSALFGTQNLHRTSLNWDYLLRFCMVGSVACCAVVVVALQLVSVEDKAAYTAFALSIPFQSVGVLCSALLRAGGQAGRGAFAEVGLAQGIAAAATIVLVAADAADPARVGLAFTGSWALVCAWSLVAARRAWQTEAPPGTVTPRPTLSSLGAMMSSSLLFYVLTWSPIGVLVLVSTQSEVAWFGAAARFPTLIALVPTIQLTAGLPIIASYVARHRLDDANREIRSLNVRAAAVALTSGAVLVLAGPWVMALFGPGFEGAATALTILVIGQVGAVLLGPASILPLVTGYERHAMVALCVTLPVAVVAEALLATRWGAAGAAAGWSMSIGIFGLTVAVILHRGAGIVSYLTIGPGLRPRPMNSERQ